MNIPERFHAPILIAVFSVFTLALIFVIYWATYSSR
jgi:hypothetical protein